MTVYKSLLLLGLYSLILVLSGSEPLVDSILINSNLVRFGTVTPTPPPTPESKLPSSTKADNKVDDKTRKLKIENRKSQIVVLDYLIIK